LRDNLVYVADGDNGLVILEIQPAAVAEITPLEENRVRIRAQGRPDQPLTIEVAGSLDSGAQWSTFLTTNGSALPIEITDTSTNQPQRYYRLRQP
jgi:hypothetical protein